ncbi:uncharacterized protein LOC125887234 [Epinephelus fuscoguttatus]|uniref:uncharacterized protein LOC125887234 n=1 Tax=Epinephelus fuscoguttatus TaxID=293821 RepID=UPI0020D0027C|nr:uncharacterized protein LOC125887234 [Epinephelus fuscoguttatus]
MTDHTYTYSCVTCGYHPVTVAMALHKKGVFSMPVSSIEQPPPDYDGKVNVDEFWESVSLEMVSRGLMPTTAAITTTWTASIPTPLAAPIPTPSAASGSTTTFIPILSRFQLCNEDCGGMKHMLHTSAGSSVTDLQLNTVLDIQKPKDEVIGVVGTSVLKRLDFLELGLNREVEATIINCCLWLVSQIAGHRGKDVFAVNGYVISTWKQPFTVIPILSLPNVPAQGATADCGVFMLMYALYMALEWHFDFSLKDVPQLRRWWCQLLLDNIEQQRKRKHESESVDEKERKRKRMEGTEQTLQQPFPQDTAIQHEGEEDLAVSIDTLFQLPSCLLEEIFAEVVLSDGDVAILTLSLVCHRFKEVVSTEHFRRKAHFMWLNSVATSSKFTERYRAEFCNMYSLETCRECNETYKNCIPVNRIYDDDGTSTDNQANTTASTTSLTVAMNEASTISMKSTPEEEDYHQQLGTQDLAATPLTFNPKRSTQPTHACFTTGLLPPK